MLLLLQAVREGKHAGRRAGRGTVKLGAEAQHQEQHGVKQQYGCLIAAMYGEHIKCGQDVREKQALTREEPEPLRTDD